MSENSRRRIRRALLSVLTLVVILVILAAVDRLRNKNEEYAVYSAYLSDGITSNPQAWDLDTPIQIVVEDTTEMSGNGGPWARNVVTNQLGFHSLDVSTRISFIVRNMYRTRIFPKFTLPKRTSVLPVAETELLPLWNSSESFRRMGHSRLSGVGFNPTRTQAIFFIEHFCGGLCGGGWYVLMEKVDGTWQVRGTYSAWIS